MAEEKARLLIRIPVGLKARLSELADRDRRSLNREIEYFLEQAVQPGPKAEVQGISRSRQEGKKGKKVKKAAR